MAMTVKESMACSADTEWGRAVEKPAAISDETRKDDSISISDESSTIEVAIVGGGLAGLAVAIGLHRKKIPCKVYERAPVLRSTSQGMLCIQ